MNTPLALNTGARHGPAGLGGRHADLFLVALVLGVLVVLFVPVPRLVLDFLILANFAFAFLILLLTFHMARPVEFSTFPSLLLIATLFRLSLNVAATRLILSEGDAGRVIAAIGSYVVGGNYVIGLIVFLILIVVQYVVVTNGAQRVSEVAARFTLDSMPGQQMSIDADLNMGFIDQAEAQQRRRHLEKEAGFYGAMDGASKFVKGDAIAGIIILLVNIIGGLAIGVMQHGMPWAEALQTYTLLTIGDGIVTQVPALVISVGTGIIVTRSAADGNLSREVVRQLSSFPKTLFLVFGALLMLLVLPGIPAWPTLLLASLVLLLAWRAGRAADRPDVAEEAAEGPVMPADTNDVIYRQLRLDPVELRLGSGLMASLGSAGSALPGQLAQFRSDFARESGMVLPEIRLRGGVHLAADAYALLIEGVPVARGALPAGRALALPGAAALAAGLALPGIPARDPAYGLSASWVDAQEAVLARAAGCNLAEGASVLLSHITTVLRREAPDLLTRAQAERLLGRVRDAQPALVEELIPTVLSVSEVQKVLQNLLREQVGIRNLEAILEALGDAARHGKDIEFLTEAVRHRLARAICHSLSGDNPFLQVITIEPPAEARLLHYVRGLDGHQGSAAEHLPVEQLLTRLMQAAERMRQASLLPVLVCSADLRRHLLSMMKRACPDLRVLSMSDIPRNIELKSSAVLSMAGA
jgi:flagellar biosynthesis protein FlhA